MKVIIAEKPSVAREIAAIVGASSKKEGYLEGNGYAVTWAFGHLVGSAMPEAYGFTGFKRENLPILPKEFILVPRQVREGKEWKNDPGAMKQLKIIGELFADAERIIVATDAGREGELIFRYIYHYLNCRKPFDRLWISSLTDRAIREGLQNLRSGSDYDNLYLSAKARSEADWLVGINASQALSVVAGRGSWSLGRVQTPTLAIICTRYLENRAFTPQTYFQLKLHTAKDATVFPALSVSKYDRRDAAETAFAAVTDAGQVRVVKVEKKQITEQPPLLYDLTSLQKEMNTRYGFSAEKTLDIAQKLYETKLITYPRTGSRYIPEDMLPEIYPLLNALMSNPCFTYQAAAVSNSELNTRSVDNDKVTDHHAILTTMNVPNELSPDERTIYDRIGGRVVEAFAQPCIKAVTAVLLESGGIQFEVKGTVIKSAAWRKVWKEKEERNDDETPALPALAEGDMLPVKGCDVLTKQTKPRPIHTESSLLAAMESAGRDLSDEAEREAMKDSGIGTPATRAAIIETLFARDYIRREKKSLIPTDKGLAVYEAVREKKIADVAMTGGWELALSKIATGEMDAFTFRQGIEVYASQITTDLLAAAIVRADDRATTKCPRCGQSVVFYPKVAKCQNPDCGLMVFRTIAKKELSDAQLTDLFGKGKTSVIKGFTGSGGKPFDAAVVFDTDYKTVFDFPPRKQVKQERGGMRK
jgi:DNA topoisomerase-3